jgi:hypothetical protein
VNAVAFALYLVYREPRPKTVTSKRFPCQKAREKTCGRIPAIPALRRANAKSRMPASPNHEITDLLQAWNRGDEEALQKLTPLVYEELYRAAKRCVGRGRREQTLQTTALINELYLKVVDLRRVSWQNRAHFFAICARQMRWILIDFYRSGRYEKRGGGAERITFEETAVVSREAGRDLLAK